MRGGSLGAKFAWTVVFMVSAGTFSARSEGVSSFRPPRDDVELRAWLENMVVHHRFTDEEVRLATGLDLEEIRAARERFDIRTTEAPSKEGEGGLLVLPYPGGRHPRIGFLEGAVDPQRETKVSVFLPWEQGGYVVADIPEAIWWNPPGKEGDDPAPRELLYLAHTHVPTHWTKRGMSLEATEWVREEDGALVSERTLPNGIRFGTRVSVEGDQVEMEQWLANGTPEILTGLRVQNCVMLKAAPGFRSQTGENKVFRPPYAACRNPEGTRWVITAWDPSERTWGNERCPCLHSDPRFPDCPPGQTVRLRGWLSFYEGKDLETELDRIEATGWREPAEETR